MDHWGITVDDSTLMMNTVTQMIDSTVFTEKELMDWENKMTTKKDMGKLQNIFEGKYKGHGVYTRIANNYPGYNSANQVSEAIIKGIKKYIKQIA